MRKYIWLARDVLIAALIAIALIVTFVPYKALSQTPVLQQIAMAIWKPASSSFEALSQCDKVTAFTVNTGSILIPQASNATGKIYICSFSINNPGGTIQNFDLFEGMAGIITPTMANCALTPTALIGANSAGTVTPTSNPGASFLTGSIPLQSSTGSYNLSSPFSFVNTQVVGDSICLGVSGTNPMSGQITYNIH